MLLELLTKGVFYFLYILFGGILINYAIVNFKRKAYFGAGIGIMATILQIAAIFRLMLS